MARLLNIFEVSLETVKPGEILVVDKSQPTPLLVPVAVPKSPTVTEVISNSIAANAGDPNRITRERVVAA